MNLEVLPVTEVISEYFRASLFLEEVRKLFKKMRRAGVRTITSGTETHNMQC